MPYASLKWEAEAYMSYEPLDDVSFQLRQEQLLTLAYFKHLRDHVIKKGFSFMASFDGRHRSAKSTTAATLGCLWDDSFERQFESRIVQDHIEFMDAIERIAKQNIQGGVIMVDEAGISMASTDWYENFMKTITKTMQMFGYLYPVVLFVAH